MKSYHLLANTALNSTKKKGCDSANIHEFIIDKVIYSKQILGFYFAGINYYDKIYKI